MHNVGNLVNHTYRMSHSPVKITSYQCSIFHPHKLSFIFRRGCTQLALNDEMYFNKTRLKFKTTKICCKATNSNGKFYFIGFSTTKLEETI